MQMIIPCILPRRPSHLDSRDKLRQGWPFVIPNSIIRSIQQPKPESAKRAESRKVTVTLFLVLWQDEGVVSTHSDLAKEFFGPLGRLMDHYRRIGMLAEGGYLRAEFRNAWLGWIGKVGKNSRRR